MTSAVHTAIITTSETFDDLLPAAEAPAADAASAAEIASKSSALSPPHRHHRANEQQHSQKKPTVVVLDDDREDSQGLQATCSAWFQTVGRRVASGSSRLWRQLSYRFSCRRAAERVANQRARAARRAAAAAMVSGSGRSALDALEIRRRSSVVVDRLTSSFGRLAGAVRTGISDDGRLNAAARFRSSWAAEFETFNRMLFWRDIAGEIIGMFFLVIVGCGAGLTHGRSSVAVVDQERQLRLALAYGKLLTRNCHKCMGV